MLEVKNISKNYSDESGYTVNLLKDISFKLSGNSVYSILAPSGSGKSSLLKIITGLEKQSSGEIVTEHSKPLIYIPSEPSSFPWLNVTENILFGIPGEKSVDVNTLIKIAGLEGYETHFPHNKSYGFRFRISLARSLANKPSFIIVDEPFNKMDELTKSELYLLIREINLTTQTSFLFTTTNISEAIFLSDHVFLMKKNPGEILESFEINLPKQRDISIFSSNDFIQLRSKIEQSFKKIDSQRLFNISI